MLDELISYIFGTGVSKPKLISYFADDKISRKRGRRIARMAENVGPDARFEFLQRRMRLIGNMRSVGV